MTSETILLIVGLVLLSIALLASVKTKNDASGLISIKYRVFLGILGILLVIYGGYSYGLINPQSQLEQVSKASIIKVEYPVKQVQIISPIQGDAVNCRMLTMGVYPEGHDKDIWVLLKPSDGKYYPQSDHTNTSYKRNGELQVITRFGGDKDELFEIVVYETNAEASQFFSTTIDSWKQALEYPGLEDHQLPSGANELQRIEVSLKDNCRGVF